MYIYSISIYSSIHINSLQIDVVADLPGVGRNLQDHLNVYGLTWTVRPGVEESPSVLSSLDDYVKRRQGGLLR